MEVHPPALHLVLLGPPGSGKSTVARPLVAQHGLTLIATGQRLRDEIAARTPIGLAVTPFLERGELAPDDLMEQLLRGSLAKITVDTGFLLDGYPRTEYQARMLEATLADVGRPLTAVIDLVVADDEVVRRMSGRRMCVIAGETPIPLHIDDADEIADCLARGGRLTKRDDDSHDLIRQRLAVYHEQTVPLIAFYRERRLLLSVDASGDADVVGARIAASLDEMIRTA